MKLLGFKIDVPEDLVRDMQSRQYLLWVGEGQPPKGLSGAADRKIYRNEAIIKRLIKRKLSIKGEVLDKLIEDSIKNGSIASIGWKDVPANGISLTRHLLIPLLESVGETFEKDPKKGVGPYRAVLKRVRADQTLMQPEKIMDVVLVHGCFNGVAVGRHAVLGAAVVHYLQNILSYNFSSPFSMIGYNRQDVTNDEDTGEVKLTDPEISAWLFNTEPPIGSRSEYGDWVQKHAYACGSVMPSGDRHVILRPTSSTDLGTDAVVLLDAGYTVSMEEKSRRLYPTGFVWTDDDGVAWFSAPTHGLKEHKAFARDKMHIAVHCTLKHGEEDSYLSILTSDGPKSLMRGQRIRCAIGNFVGSMASGAEHANGLIISVIVERTIRGQILKTEVLKIDGEAMVGQIIEDGQSVIGMDGFMVNDTGHPVVIDRAPSIVPSDNGNFASIVVNCHQDFDLDCGKLRGPAKLQYVNYKTRGVYARMHDLKLVDGKFVDEKDERRWRKWAHDAFPFHLLPSDVKLIVGQEAIKNPDLTFRHAFANTTMTKCVVGKDGTFDDETEKKYVEWYNSNLQTVTLPISISMDYCPIAVEGGHKPYLSSSISVQTWKRVPKVGSVIKAGQSIIGIKGVFLTEFDVIVHHVEKVNGKLSVFMRHYWTPETKAKGNWKMDVTSQFIVGDLIFGIESLPVPARSARTALTPPMLLSLIGDHRRVHQVKYSQKTLGLMENLEFEDVYAEDIAALFFNAEGEPRLWKDFLRDAQEQWPNGVAIKVPRQDGGEDSISLDFRAVRLFTHGDVSPDDAWGMLTYRVIALFAMMSDRLDALSDELADNPFGVQPETDEDKKALQEFFDVYNDLLSSMYRCKKAMFALGFSNGMLRRMATPARVVPFLVAIGSNSIPTGIAFVNQKTADKYHVNEWYFPKSKDGEETSKRREGYLLVRFPGDGYAHVTVRVVPWVPDGVVLCSTIDVQVGTKGDSDGDLVMLVSNRELPAYVHRSRKDREVIIRYLRMMAANRGTVIESHQSSIPYHMDDPDWDEKEVAVKISEMQFARYTKFAPLANSPIVDWITQQPLWSPKGDKYPGTIKVNMISHKNRMLQCSVFTTNGIGIAYGAWHSADILCAALYGLSWPLYQMVRHALDIAAALYEDIFLAGGPNAKQWAFYKLFSKPKAEELDKWYAALIDLGFVNIRQPIIIPFGINEDGEEEEIETDHAKLLYLMRVMTLAYQSYYSSGKVSETRLEELGEFAQFIPLCGMMRSFFGYNLHPSWMKSMPDRTSINDALGVVCDTSPIAKFYWDIISRLLPLATEVAQTALIERLPEPDTF